MRGDVERLLKMADNWIIVEDGRYLDDCRRWQIFGLLFNMADIWMIAEDCRYLDDCSRLQIFG